MSNAKVTEHSNNGWGSFHSERGDDSVDSLIGKPVLEYKIPSFPINTSIDSFPIVGNVDGEMLTTMKQKNIRIIPFGAQVKKELFYLTEEYTFLNHGAFGASLRPVVEVARRWTDHMESQPLRFIDRQLLPLLVYTIRRMASFVNSDPKDIVLLPNVTTGLNTILRSLKLQPNEIVVSLNIGYGSSKKMMKYVCDVASCTHEEIYIPLPITNSKVIVNQIKRYLKRTLKPENGGENEQFFKKRKISLAVIDGITSNSGLALPLREIINIFHSVQIPVLIDGAHMLGSTQIDLEALNCDYFLANAHKWLCSAKGCAIMYVKREHQANIVPLNISHGYGSSFTSNFIWCGLQDYGPWLSLLTCIDFYEACGVDIIYNHIRNTVIKAASYLAEQWNTDIIAPDNLLGPMACIRLPGPRVPLHPDEANQLQDALYFKHKIEVPIKMLENRLYVRISSHIYNTFNDFASLKDAMLDLRPKLSPEEDEKDKIYAETAELVKPATSCG